MLLLMPRITVMILTVIGCFGAGVMGSLCAGISLYHWSFLSSGSFELVVRFGTYCGMIGSAISTLFLQVVSIPKRARIHD